MKTTRAIFVSGNKEVRQYHIQVEWVENLGQVMNEMADIGTNKLFKVPMLEVSRISPNLIGRKLSAKSLVMSAFLGDNPDTRTVEAIYQTSKKGGIDGRLHFVFNGREYPIQPRSIFYDWIYCIALGNNMLHKKYINKEEFMKYRMFTDVWFNPIRKAACQARSCALFSTLLRTGRVKEAMSSFENFMKVHQEIVSYETYTTK